MAETILFPRKELLRQAGSHRGRFVAVYRTADQARCLASSPPVELRRALISRRGLAVRYGDAGLIRILGGDRDYDPARPGQVREATLWPIGRKGRRVVRISNEQVAGASGRDAQSDELSGLLPDRCRKGVGKCSTMQRENSRRRTPIRPGGVGLAAVGDHSFVCGLTAAGSANATYASSDFEPSLPPPHAITIYCRPPII